jgi:hypothetical protein
VRYISRLPLLSLLMLALTACVSIRASTDLPGPTLGATNVDAARLTDMSEQALHIAQKEAADIVLRQVDTDLSTTDFRFVDRALTREIVVLVPEPDTPKELWRTVVNSVSPLLTSAEPALDLENLSAGPQLVASAITAHWPGCTLHNLTLYRQNERLTWTAFCTTPQGMVSGSMDAQSGVFQPSDAAPAALPLTATP